MTGLLLALVLMTLLALALTALGLAIAWRKDSTQDFHAVMSLFLLPMWLLSGAFFRHGAEGWLGWIVTLNPLTYGVAALRQCLTPADAAGLPPAVICWLVTIAFTAAMLVVCWRIADENR